MTLIDQFKQEGDFDAIATVGGVTWFGSGELRALTGETVKSVDWEGVNLRPVSRTEEYAYLVSSMQGGSVGWTTHVARIDVNGNSQKTSVLGDIANIVRCGDAEYILAQTDSSDGQSAANFIAPLQSDGLSDQITPIELPKESEFRGKIGVGKCIQLPDGKWTIVQLFQRESDNRYVLASIDPDSGFVGKLVELSFDPEMEVSPINASGFPQWINEDKVTWADSNGIKMLNVGSNELTSLWSRPGANNVESFDYVFAYDTIGEEVIFAQQSLSGGVEFKSFNLNSRSLENFGPVDLGSGFSDVLAFEVVDDN
ncbi:hypothetical protein WG915_01585 [Corynebacterium sp. H128]|uniref:hypothetical protein n=1 Tax=Corynebacterium sp. H128 TaxID=3133427 RepID=UPI00309FA40D